MCQAPRRHGARLLITAMGLVVACEGSDERRAERAVKALVSANAYSEAAAMRKVVSLGRFALPDIEQQLHAADVAARRFKASM